MGSVTCGLTLRFCDGYHIEIVLVVGSVAEINSWCRTPHRLLGPSSVFVATSQDSTVGFLSDYLGNTVTFSPVEVTLNLLEIQLKEENSSLHLSVIRLKYNPDCPSPSTFDLVLKSQKRLFTVYFPDCFHFSQ